MKNKQNLKAAEADELIRMVARCYMESIYRNDALSFWGVLSSEAQGYFKGMWKANGVFTLSELKDLSDDNFFIRDQLEEVLEKQRSIWGDNLTDNGLYSNNVIHDDEAHARVKFIPNMGKTEVIFIKPTLVKAIHIPLVFELAKVDHPKYSYIHMWRVDYLAAIAGV